MNSYLSRSSQQATPVLRNSLKLAVGSHTARRPTMASSLGIQDTVRMASGYDIPVVGFGVYLTPPEITEAVCATALEFGYRHIDSAAVYHNEAPSADAILASGLDRSEVFFTSKVQPNDISYKGAKAQVARTLAVTRLGYIDLMLLHAPFGGSRNRKGAWRALVEAVEEGKVRSIGVSNYGVHHLDELERHIAELEHERGGKGKGGVISVGQWEIHPWCQREDIVQWSRERGVVVEAYSPLTHSKKLGDRTLKAIARKYGKTPAQVLLRWSLQKGYVPLPKSITPERIEENADVSGWELDEKDLESLGHRDVYLPLGWDPTVLSLEV